ncbi:hypothetical protein TNCV_1134811 [Trichonephila clavipes]|nr:hypothetical protein TNCV_1134811 [Trichonephila clavipes]
MLSDRCTRPWGHWVLFDLGQAPTPRLTVIMVKSEPAPIDNRHSLYEKNTVTMIGDTNEARGREERPGWRELEESTGWRELEESPGWRREESPGWRELEESPEKKETWMVDDRDWSGKKGETMNTGGVGGLESMF